VRTQSTKVGDMICVADFHDLCVMEFGLYSANFGKLSGLKCGNSCSQNFSIYVEISLFYKYLKVCSV